MKINYYQSKLNQWKRLNNVIWFLWNIKIIRKKSTLEKCLEWCNIHVYGKNYVEIVNKYYLG